MGLGDTHVVLFDDVDRVIEQASGKEVHRWDEFEGCAEHPLPGFTPGTLKPPSLAKDPLRRRFALGWPDRINVVQLG